MSQNSSQSSNDPGTPRTPSLGDVIAQAALTTATFAIVSAVAGPVVGAAVAAVVGGGDSSS